MPNIKFYFLELWISEFTIATATGVPPFGPCVIIFGIFVFWTASFESAAPTKPTGTPIIDEISILSASNNSIALYNAVGAFPIAIIPLKSFAAYSIAAAARVIFFL